MSPILPDFSNSTTRLLKSKGSSNCKFEDEWIEEISWARWFEDFSSCKRRDDEGWERYSMIWFFSFASWIISQPYANREVNSLDEGLEKHGVSPSQVYALQMVEHKWWWDKEEVLICTYSITELYFGSKLKSSWENKRSVDALGNLWSHTSILPLSLEWLLPKAKVDWNNWLHLIHYQD